MTIDELRQLLREPSKLGSQHLNDLMDLSQQYPYCAPLHHLILTCLHRSSDLRFASELHKRILYITDPKTLFFSLKELNSTVQVNTSLPQEESQDTHDTFDIVSSFLEDHPDDSSDIEQMLDQLRSGDMDGNTVEEDPSDIIAEFLNKGEQAEIIPLTPEIKTEPTNSATPSAPTDDTSELAKEDELFTETLARIYIRQGKYDQALRIFKSLNLKYSKKNSYFAEQITFLEKLVQNTKK